VTAIDPSEDVDTLAAAGRPSLQRGSDGLIDGIPGAPPPVGSAHDTSDDDAEFLEDETSDDDAVVPSSAERPRPAKLHLQVEEGHFDDEVHPIEQPDIYDEHISYVPPGMDLLDKYPAEHLADDDELKANALTLKDKLDTFKIKIEDVTVTPGPVITQYEFVPADGVKISRIESLSDDIALALKAKGIRIIAPVPGKGTVGVEIPNHNPSVVHFSSIITSKTFNDNDKQLPIALGKTIIGETFSTDLAKLPHLLIAGSTGSGKSVGVNAILMSLIYKVHPRDLKFVIIDPKKVEMTLYAGLKHHFLAASPDVDESIVTTPQNAALVLKSLCMEMDQRYTMLSEAGKRKITEFNAMVASGTAKNKAGKTLRPLPYIVVIIDELADLMITARNEVEEPIIRLAQLARAVGIHLVVATQRPSVDVITGLIKANFPARIAYQLASKIDSRTILDSSGAEQLLGNGDMLFTHGGVKPMRLQNSFVSTEEVESITTFIARQKGYSSPYMLPSVLALEGVNKVLMGDRDPLFADAAAIVIKTQQASTSFLQRRLKIGYSRAARIVDELEYAGVVGPAEGSKPRTVLLESEADLERLL
ncbi:MAG: DNA translocase FtsK, partial [Candidatus Kapaibacterium sp.]